MFIIQQKNGQTPPVFEIVWWWLPYFISNNQRLMADINVLLQQKFSGVDFSNCNVWEGAHEFVVDYICEKLAVFGLKSYLMGIRFVGEDALDNATTEKIALEHDTLELHGYRPKTDSV